MNHLISWTISLTLILIFKDFLLVIIFIQLYVCGYMHVPMEAGSTRSLPIAAATGHHELHDMDAGTQTSAVQHVLELSALPGFYLVF